MRTVVIGDTHGRPTWKKIVASEPWDRIVFLGDYFDSYEDFSSAEQIYNFNEIVLFKDEHPETTLLVGNHDFHYVMTGEYYSGFQQKAADQIGQAIMAVREKLQVCVEDQGWLMSHAGVSMSWCRRQGIVADDTLVGQINAAWRNRPDAFRFYNGDLEGYGDHPMQGPLWVRPDSLMSHPAHPKQIVGHTWQDKKGVRIAKDAGDQLVLADAMPHQFVIIHDGQIEIGRVSQL
jgi:hypothetical protein